MHCSLWGVMAAGFLLCGGPVALAQSSGPANVSQTTKAKSQPAEKSAATSALICDSSGKVCIAKGTRSVNNAAPAASPSVVSHAPTTSGTEPIAQSSGSANIGQATKAGSKPPEKSTAISSLVCDSSGKVCIAVGRRSAGGAAPAASPAPILRAAATPAATPVPSSFSHVPVIKPPALTSTASHAPATPAATAVALPSPIAAHETHSQQPLARTSRPAICDASGRICVPPLQEPAAPTHGAGTRIDGVGEYEAVDGMVIENPSYWVVHAYKARHRLEVYFRGHLYKTYHAVFGRSLDSGAKLWSGDRRTPEGNYLIIGKHRSARFGWFLHINYPNERDHERFERSRAAHLIPASAGEGGQIGIHGTDSPYLNVSDVNWTTGCISVDNADISELARLLPVGTLVMIEP
jgi:L,D-transpeptidase catalytic domain